MKRLAFFLILASAMAFGADPLFQDSQDASNVAGANKQTTARFNNYGSANIALEFKFSGAPGTVSIPILGCERGGTCTTIATFNSTSNGIYFVNQVYDYISLTPVFTGGTNPFVTVNYTAVSQSSGSSGVGVAAGGPGDQVGNVSVGAWQCASTTSNAGVTCAIMPILPYMFGSSLYDVQYYCDKSVAINTAAAATVQLVALSGTTKVRVCSFLVNGAGATTVKLQYGTGALCATGTTDLTGPMSLAANTTITGGVGGVAAEVMRTPNGQALCLVNSAAIQVSGYLTYQQR